MKRFKDFISLNEKKISFEEFEDRYGNDVRDIYWYNVDSDLIDSDFTEEDAMEKAYQDYLNESLNLKDTYSYVGTCMNSFDDDDVCINDAFEDTDHFFNSWYNAEEITSDGFWEHINPHSEKYDEVMEYTTNGEYNPEFRYSEEDDVYFAFVNDDTHYFFIRD